jgi:hypothetical protein
MAKPGETNGAMKSCSTKLSSLPELLQVRERPNIEGNCSLWCIRIDNEFSPNGHLELARQIFIRLDPQLIDYEQQTKGRQSFAAL